MAFTNDEIAQIIQEFFNTVGARQYIGARYVPIFGRKDEDSIIWDNTKPYEPLTIVLYQGNSFTSRQYVPIGVEITNQEFWANTGNYNAQVEEYRRVAQGALDAANAAQGDIDTLLPKEDFSSENTVKQYVDSSITSLRDSITDGSLISELVEVDELADDYCFQISDGDSSKKVTGATIATYTLGKLDDIKVFRTYSDMTNDTDTSWDYCEILDGKTVPGCFTDTVVRFKRDSNGLGTGVPVLSNGDKAMPLANFKDGSINYEGNLANVAWLVNNPECEYRSACGNFILTNGNCIDANTDKFLGQCSTFSYNYILGMDKNSTRWINGENTDNIFGAHGCKFPDEVMALDPNYNASDGYVGAGMQAYIAIVNGYGYFPENISDIKVGDVLYTGSADESEEKYLDINHCCVVVGKDESTQMLQIAQWGGISGQGWSTASTGVVPRITLIDFDVMSNVLRVGARFPIDNPIQWNTLFSRDDAMTVSTVYVGSLNLYRKEFLIVNKKLVKGNLYKIRMFTDFQSNPFELVVTSGNDGTLGTAILGRSVKTYGGELELYFIAPNLEQTNDIHVFMYSGDSAATISIEKMEFLCLEKDIEFYNDPIEVNSSYTNDNTAINYHYAYVIDNVAYIKCVLGPLANIPSDTDTNKITLFSVLNPNSNRMEFSGNVPSDYQAKIKQVANSKPAQFDILTNLSVTWTYFHLYACLPVNRFIVEIVS